MLKKQLENILKDVLVRIVSHKKDFPRVEIIWEVPSRVEHGDFSTNLAMILAKHLKKSPISIAESLVKEMKTDDFVSRYVQKIEILKPGFVNVHFLPQVYFDQIPDIIEQGDRYGSFSQNSPRKIRIEFVSANPTGPLHIGHGRGAVIGDVMASLYEFLGYEVIREYYLNDCGRQTLILGKTAKAWKKALLLGVEPDLTKSDSGEWYLGSYMKDVANQIDVDIEEEDFIWGREASFIILDRIKEDLKLFSVKKFDMWSSEQKLRDSGEVQDAIDFLKEKGLAVLREGALWFLSSKWGDSKDRVLVKANGELTYLASDIAFHKKKMEEAHVHCINIWGADHHGYVQRIKASVEAMGNDSQNLSIILCQLVRLMRSGKDIPMSTRSGQFVSLKEIIEEIGADATRFSFLMYKSDTHLNFDLDKVKSQSMDNPVYYVQYAYARICGIIRSFTEKNLTLVPIKDILFHTLSTEIEISLAKKLTAFQETIHSSLVAMEPCYMVVYLRELSSDFHTFYRQCRVVSDDVEQSQARMALVKAMQVIFRNTFSLLGISAPQSM